MTQQLRNHINDQISDFVLELLPPDENIRIRRHINECSACRIAVNKERKVGRAVYSTILEVTQPEPTQLQALMPPIPARRRPLFTAFTPYRQWAIACLFIVVMTGVMVFGRGNGFNTFVRPSGSHSATISSLTASATSLPTTTRSADAIFFTTLQPEESEITGIKVNQNQPSAQPVPAAPQITPAPAATYYQ